MILSSKVQEDAWKNARAIGSKVYSSVSMLGMVMLVAISVVWTLEKAPSQTFVNVQNVVHTQVGSYLDLTSNIRVRTDASKAVYRLWLTDSSGEAVYVFPDHAITNPTDFILAPDGIRIPPSIKKGEYMLHAQVMYPFNPFKNGNINMTLATLFVE